LNSQKDLPGEKWKKMEEWCQKDAIIKRYKKIVGKNPPKAISNKGRIMTNKGKITNGSQRTGRNYSTFNGIYVHILIWEAFSVEVIGDKFLLHKDSHESNTFDENGKVIHYSNYLETLRLGTHQENMEDLSREKQRVAELNPEKEFIVRNKEGIEVMKSSYIPRCVEKLKEMYPGKRFKASCISDCLKKERKTHLGFTFNYVIFNRL
jgi:hypothetical protein